MKFYSYHYLVGRLSIMHMVSILLAGAVSLVLFYCVYRYFKSGDFKYRELAIMAALVACIIGLVNISAFQVKAVSDNQVRESLHFIEQISEEFQIPKERIYINSQASIDGAIVIIGESYYRVITAGAGSNYILESLNLYKPNAELVE